MDTPNNTATFSILNRSIKLCFQAFPAILILVFITALGGIFALLHPVNDTLSLIVKLVDGMLAWIIGLTLYYILMKKYYFEDVSMMSALGVGFRKLLPSLGLGIVTMLILLPAILFMSVPTLLTTTGNIIFGDTPPPGSEIILDKPLSSQSNANMHTIYSNQPHNNTAITQENVQAPNSISQAAINESNTMLQAGVLITVISYFIGFIWMSYFLIRLIFCIPLIVNQNKTVFESISNSFKLTKGRWWKTLLILFFGILPAFLIGIIVGALAIFGTTLGLPNIEIIAGIAALIGEMILVPWIPALLTVYLEALQPRGT